MSKSNRPNPTSPNPSSINQFGRLKNGSRSSYLRISPQKVKKNASLHRTHLKNNLTQNHSSKRMRNSKSVAVEEAEDEEVAAAEDDPAPGEATTIPMIEKKNNSPIDLVIHNIKQSLSK